MMKFIHILFVIMLLSLCFPSFAFSEGGISTEQFYSDNREYAIEVTGWVYDGVGGDCLYALYDRQTHQYWQKKLLYDGDPAISNTGDVAIPQPDNTVVYYDKDGNVKGKAAVTGIFDFPDCMADCITHQYSWDGLYYYVVTMDSQDNTTTLWCFDQYGNQQWKTSFLQEIFYHIRTTSDRILIGAQSHYTTYLLDSHSGRILAKYEESHPFFNPLFLQDGEVFVLQTSGQYRLYDSKTGTLIGDVPIEKVYPLIQDPIPLHILFALEYLGWQVRYSHLTLSDEIIQQLKYLQKTNTFSFTENHLILVYRRFLFEELGIENIYYHNAIPYTGQLNDHYLNGNIALEQTYHNGHLTQQTHYWHDYKGVKESEKCFSKDSCKIWERKWSESGDLVFEMFPNDKGQRVERYRDENGQWVETTYH